MQSGTVHTAIYDTMADWEVGFATAHINNGYWQRRPGSVRVVTVAETAEPVTTMGGLRITPDVVLAEVRPADSAMLNSSPRPATAAPAAIATNRP